MSAPILVSLPHGLNASGVTTWAVRLLNALARAGRACGLVIHDEPPGQRALALEIDARVETFDARGLPPMDGCDGDLSDFLPVYRMAVGVLATRAGGPVVCFPSLVGDSCGVFAELSRSLPALVRTVFVHHSDTRYNDLVCEHYAPMVSAFVGVSGHITARLRAAHSTRAHDVYGIPYGVETPACVRPRDPLRGRPLRLVYTGRMDHEQKRVLALVAMSDELGRRGIAHELALIGDGPAAAEVDALCGVRPAVRRFDAAPPGAVVGALEAADFFVLPSRYEGLSVSLLEALARGCIPVLTPSRSGTGQLVAQGETGLIAPAGPEAGEAEAGRALAAGIAGIWAPGTLGAPRSGTRAGVDAALHGVRERGLALVRSRFGSEMCAARYAAVIERAARGPARPWPAHLPAAFTGAGGGGSGTVPADAPQRLGSLLEALAGRRVAVYGTGRHTLELREVFASSPAQLVAFLDDDASRRGSTLWGLPVLAPEDLGASGAEEVVLSSWLHQDTMAARCPAVAGVRVHGIYPRPGSGALTAPTRPRGAPAATPSA